MIEHLYTQKKKPLHIWVGGIVTRGKREGSLVVSSVKNKRVLINRAKYPSFFHDYWGIWYKDHTSAFDISLKTKLGEFLESSDPFEIDSRASDLIKLHKDFHEPLAKSVYYLQSARRHLHDLLECYVLMTTVIGPKVYSDDGGIDLGIRYPVPFIRFDAYLSSIKSLVDSFRFLVWRTLGRETGLPRNFASLTNSNLPAQLEALLRDYGGAYFDDVKRYRDNATHYTPPGGHYWPRLLYNRCPNADFMISQVWQPLNPEVRSLAKFEHSQKDAFSFGRSIYTGTLEFNANLLDILGRLYTARNSNPR